MFTKWTATLLLALPFLTSATPALDPRASGDATYYHPGKTSCGPVHSDDDLIVALSPAQFTRHPDACGRYIRVMGYNGHQVTVQVADKCPECSLGSIDLTSAGFLMLFGSLEIGRAAVTWDWV
jgi:expansin (peptidoglycan-binding protein)